MKTGYVTGYMHNLKPGAYMGIRGPYGWDILLTDFWERSTHTWGRMRARSYKVTALCS
jgi:hypothetical protein